MATRRLTTAGHAREPPIILSTSDDAAFRLEPTAKTGKMETGQGRTQTPASRKLHAQGWGLPVSPILADGRLPVVRDNIT